MTVDRDNKDLNYVVHNKRRVFDGFFKIDELTLTHRQVDGAMSGEKNILVFERGDAVAVLLYNAETDQVILVQQFRAPAIGKGRVDAWIVEPMAGMIRLGESPEQAAIRETLEETGYRVDAPELIATFFTSPGGSSERIFMYFAKVSTADKIAEGGGQRSEGEDIRILSMPSEDLFRQLANKELEDAKLIIAAYHLKDRVASLRRPQPASVIKFARSGTTAPVIAIRTGDILKVTGVDIWVNSENTDMMMDRIIGKSISASIRYAGAEKDDAAMIEDTIANELRQQLGTRTFVRLGTVVETSPGALVTNGVKSIYHVATAEGVPRKGVRTDINKLENTVERVLDRVRKRNARLFRSRFRSILFPLIGAGDGGLQSTEVAPIIAAAAAGFFDRHPDQPLQEINLLAFTARDLAVCQKAILDVGYQRLADASA